MPFLAHNKKKYSIEMTLGELKSFLEDLRSASFRNTIHEGIAQSEKDYGDDLDEALVLVTQDQIALMIDSDGFLLRRRGESDNLEDEAEVIN